MTANAADAREFALSGILSGFEKGACVLGACKLQLQVVSDFRKGDESGLQFSDAPRACGEAMGGLALLCNRLLHFQLMGKTALANLQCHLNSCTASVI